MRPIIHIVDDFLIDPERSREMIISQGFRDMEFQGSPYYTVNTNIHGHGIEDGLRLLFGRDIKMHVGAWRQGKEGSHIHNFVHADNSCAQMAAVLYLNLPKDCRGGTAFWRHNLTGWEFMPTEGDLREHHFTLTEFAEDWHNPQAWTMTSLCGMAFNRLVTYPTSIFHSRWPWEGFGTTEEDARLIGAFFFDLV